MRLLNILFILKLYAQISILKNKTVMSWSSQKKKAFFVPLILSQGNFTKICVLSQDIVY